MFDDMGLGFIPEQARYILGPLLVFSPLICSLYVGCCMFEKELFGEPEKKEECKK